VSPQRPEDRARDHEPDRSQPVDDRGDEADHQDADREEKAIIVKPPPAVKAPTLKK
jgi:hypothetical protein